MPSQSQSNTLRSPAASDVAEAWAQARAAAEFAARIAVRCVEEGHGAGPCVVRDVAEDGARRALGLARELAWAVEVAA